MGLFLSGKVAEYHGGWIEVESPAQRWSTEVRLILPCVLTAMAIDRLNSEEAGTSIGRRRLTRALHRTPTAPCAIVAGELRDVAAVKNPVWLMRPDEAESTKVERPRSKKVLDRLHLALFIAALVALLFVAALLGVRLYFNIITTRVA